MLSEGKIKRNYKQILSPFLRTKKRLENLRTTVIPNTNGAHGTILHDQEKFLVVLIPEEHSKGSRPLHWYDWEDPLKSFGVLKGLSLIQTAVKGNQLTLVQKIRITCNNDDYNNNIKKKTNYWDQVQLWQDKDKQNINNQEKQMGRKTIVWIF